MGGEQVRRTGWHSGDCSVRERGRRQVRPQGRNRSVGSETSRVA